MTKIIEYEVGKYNGHPVVIRFANVSEEDAREYAWRFAKRLQGEFGAFYPAAQNTEEMASWLEDELGEMGVGLSPLQQDLLRTLVAECSPRLKQWMAKNATLASHQNPAPGEPRLHIAWTDERKLSGEIFINGYLFGSIKAPVVSTGDWLVTAYHSATISPSMVVDPGDLEACIEEIARDLVRKFSTSPSVTPRPL